MTFEEWVKTHPFYQFDMTRGNGKNNEYWEYETKMANDCYQAGQDSMRADWQSVKENAIAAKTQTNDLHHLKRIIEICDKHLGGE